MNIEQHNFAEAIVHNHYNWQHMRVNFKICTGAAVLIIEVRWPDESTISQSAKAVKLSRLQFSFHKPCHTKFLTHCKCSVEIQP